MSELRDGKVTGHHSLQTGRATGREDYPQQLNMLEHTQPSSYSLTISKPKSVNLTPK